MAKILMVEDDLTLREVYIARFEADGHKILLADDIVNALLIAKTEQPDLIIADVMMPGGSGYDFLKKIKETPETNGLKVVMMSALSQEEDKRKAIELGATAYITKAKETLDDIAKTINKLVEKK